jgi:hypothetical protein
VLAVATSLGRHPETIAQQLLEELCPLALEDPDLWLEDPPTVLEAMADAVSSILARHPKGG